MSILHKSILVVFTVPFQIIRVQKNTAGSFTCRGTTPAFIALEAELPSTSGNVCILLRCLNFMHTRALSAPFSFAPVPNIWGKSCRNWGGKKIPLNLNSTINNKGTVWHSLHLAKPCAPLPNEERFHAQQVKSQPIYRVQASGTKGAQALALVGALSVEASHRPKSRLMCSNELNWPSLLPHSILKVGRRHDNEANYFT